MQISEKKMSENEKMKAKLIGGFSTDFRNLFGYRDVELNQFNEFRNPDQKY